MPLPGNQPVRRLRHLARRLLFAGHPPWRRWLLQMAMALAWPVGALLEVYRRLLRMPDADRPTHPWGWVRRGSHMLALAWIDNVPPRNYVAYRLHDPARRERIDASFYGSEILNLCAHLNRLNGAAGDDVQDKARFAELCRAHGLPCIPTLAVFRDGVQAMPSVPFLPDGPDLWVKDLAGDRGSGATRWQREGEVYRHAWDGRLCRPAELVAAWRQRDCIIQPCLDNHPALASLSAGALIDFRIITGIDRQGCVTVIAALAQLPCSGQPARFIFAPVGPAGEIRSPGLHGLQPVSHHPDTGEPLAGAMVPCWPQALDLVVRAHGEVPEFSRFIFLGWDVAITEAGPLLIETNAGWGGVNHQLGDGIPLGLTALPAIALDHLNGEHRCG
ncbi:sugar-transfer associated ATP-grasp domain-containing protein [Ferrovibrio sp.]|uniref:sugar-transfer associated ATP-grasp domain-containing protein n=1 Tax=Ferrovibrio sp. TaxID=1917215 RepID=UPI003D0C8879